MRSLRNLIHCDRAQDLAEYAIAISVIGLAVVLIAAAIGADVELLWSNARAVLDNVINNLP
jgi:hypothetical protein